MRMGMAAGRGRFRLKVQPAAALGAAVIMWRTSAPMSWL